MMAWYVAKMEEDICPFKILTGNLTGKRISGGPRRRQEGNIRMEPKECDINTRKWADSTQDRDYWSAVGNVALNHRIS